MHPAIKRLNGIREALSYLDEIDLRTADLKRVLTVLDLANKCIRVVLDDFQEAPATSHLLEESEALSDMIESAREKVSNFRTHAA